MPCATAHATPLIIPDRHEDMSRAGAFGSWRFGCGKERETFLGATLRFHQMGDNVNGARRPNAYVVSTLA